MNEVSQPQATGAAASTAIPDFAASVAALQVALAQRSGIVAAIEQLLNCQKKPLDWQQDAAGLGREFMACFRTAAIAGEPFGTAVARLEQARQASGLRPRANPGNDVVAPVQQLLRALHFWRQTRWPGGKGRARFAHTLFNLQILRCLVLLTLRLWDGESLAAAERMASLQQILDALWRSSPPDQPCLVRDVRWLLPVAMSPTTDELGGYFELAERIAATLPAADRIEVQRAWVQTGAGHLCAQLRHLSVRRNVPLDDHDLVLLTRKSNALDVTLLMEGLVVLFEAYAASLHTGDTDQRRQLAMAICQGVSPDPDLFLLRLDLLTPYTMIEHLFVESDAAGSARYTAMGERHLQLVQNYVTLLPTVVPALLEDCRSLAPAPEGYAAYGALYGFASNLLELMAFRTLLPDAAAPYALEDVFAPGAADKRRWVSDWRRLPHVPAEVVQQYLYAPDYVATLHRRVEQALQQCVESVTAGSFAATADPATRCGRLHVLADGAVVPDGMAELPLQYLSSSDRALVAAGKATPQDEGDLLHCRVEGEFLVSYRTANGWTGMSKDLLTEMLGQGTDVVVRGAPAQAAVQLLLLCPGLVVLDIGEG